MASAAKQHAAGTTLVELMAALAIVALFAAAATPFLGQAMQRHRMEQAAQALAQDLAEARQSAAQGASTVYVHTQPGVQWCWALSRTPSCDCTQPLPCQLKRASQSLWPDVQMQTADAGTTAFSPAAAAMVERGEWTFSHRALASTLRVRLTPLGRAHLCAPGAPLQAYSAC